MESKKLLALQNALTARFRQRALLMFFDEIRKEYPDDHYIIQDARANIQLSESNVEYIDTLAYTPQQLANFDY